MVAGCRLTFRDATNEGCDAVAMAAGTYVTTGRPGVVMFQNSCLSNAVKPGCVPIHRNGPRRPSACSAG